ncbi:putative transporter mfs2 [Daldinia childiae]|uniref:putative transporter mfs2 n=1 Tax=Daldinia childiae TaxID=326645 RepID=UPI0014466665|nr:putative transporter mfs2 [Daldinia childiae]KAF3055931.1 putative transporter mfs2 [Daldinia childiae]
MDSEPNGYAKKPQVSRPSWFQIVLHQDTITPEIRSHRYEGQGTDENPFVVSFFDGDPRDPQQFSAWVRWTLCVATGLVTFAVSFSSSSFSSVVTETREEFGGSTELGTLGVSLFVIGFILGPFVWAPTSELVGRQYIFLITNLVHTAFNIGTCFAQNQATLLTLRFFSGAFGAAPLTNAGGVIADCFLPAERGLALTVFALVPFMGPVLGPIVGGFVAQSIGWRWVIGIITILTGAGLIVCTLTLPETYAPIILRYRANRLSKETGKVYVSAMDMSKGGKVLNTSILTMISRPWLLLIFEPIILCLSLYQAVVFGTLYLTFAAFPIVYANTRHWSQGISGLPFLGLLVGAVVAILYILWDNRRYIRKLEASPDRFLPPEFRLIACMPGAVAVPVGLFWFAWTNGPEIHWIVSIIATTFFGFGIAVISLGIFNYIVDAYTIFAASALAGAVVLRSLFAAVFPLFTPVMYQNLGIHWASSVPAFLSLALTPFPFIFFRYGAVIRSKCRYAAQAADYLKQARKPAAEMSIIQESTR